MKKEEIWKDVPGYEGMYQVSDYGNVRTLGIPVKCRGGKIRIKPACDLKQCMAGKYKKVVLSKENNGINFTVHKLVAMAFLGHAPDGTNKIVVDHIDNNKLNNHLSNLRLITNRENITKVPIGLSKYAGVIWIVRDKKWSAKIIINRICYPLGVFLDEQEASEAYQKALYNYNNYGELPVVKRINKSSKYKGVCWSKRNKKWESYLWANGKSKRIGYFLTEEEAYKAYCEHKGIKAE